MSQLKVPKGTRDILGREIHLWRRIEETVYSVAQLFGYQEIRTPIFESTELFARGVGEGTDIVQKEMYTFLDKGGRSLTLRPEGTAPVMRAYLEQGFAVHEPRVKWFYLGPMFRYERPQAGRMRQFHQFGFEAIGFESPACDAEIILIAWTIYEELGLKRLSLEINSLGCNHCKPGYIEALKNFFRDRSEELCSNCKDRLERNPLRILDCKVETCQTVLRSTAFPNLQDFLCEDCKKHQAELLQTLTALGIPFVINPHLVRGLDYYTRTAFEVKTGELGAQDAVGGGGRYDNLSQALGGQRVPGVGFAAGMERIVLLLQKEETETSSERSGVYLAPLGKEGERYLLVLSRVLLQHGIPFYTDFADKTLKYHLKRAQKMGIRWVVILGEEEIQKSVFLLKDMISGEQISLSQEGLLKKLQEEISGAENTYLR
ncbi:MAG: histidine--tRNA ligase [Candidatus Atribacteria bacterium]|nr:histidine--tRNA ligase [Candidatus Atribacteria bacterium]